jgi:NAD(P)-dependent dehydrogenase (short-subunit alcohol dehydrogenase family)
VEQLGRIDVVIANAGIANYEAFNDFEDGEDTSPPLCLWSLLCWHASLAVEQYPPTQPRTKIIDVNLTGVLYSAKLAMHYFAKQRHLHSALANSEPIFIIGGSLAGYLDMPTSPVYSSTKFAVRGLLHSLRCTSPRIGARAAMVAPWHVMTPQLGSQADRLAERGIPLAHMDDVVAAAGQLISDPQSNGKWQVLRLNARLIAHEGKCLAVVPRSIKAPEGYFDVNESDQDDFWHKYNEILKSEDERPQAK